MTAEALHHTDAPSRPAAPAVARSGSPETDDDCEGEVRLWIAALSLLLEDATDFVRRGDDKKGIRSAAHRDVVEIGPMLRHLCAHARVDPGLAVEWWQRKMRQAA